MWLGAPPAAATSADRQDDARQDGARQDVLARVLAVSARGQDGAQVGKSSLASSSRSQVERGTFGAV